MSKFVRLTHQDGAASVYIRPDLVQAIRPAYGTSGCAIVLHAPNSSDVVLGSPDEVHAKLFGGLEAEDVPGEMTADASEAFSGKGQARS
jgi:hypothetical protein